jgi:hypothetical protein
MRNYAAEERMWISGRARTLVQEGLHPLEASKLAMFESAAFLKAEAEGKTLCRTLDATLEEA